MTGLGRSTSFRQPRPDSAPTLIQLTADVMQLDDQVPTGWEDDPQGVDETNQFEWVSQRTRDSAGIWGNFSAPAQWAVYIPGRDGPGVEFIFRLTATGVAPASPVTTTAQRATDDFVPANWHDDPQELTTAMPYQWVCRRKGSTEAWEEFSAPTIWARFGVDGAGVEFIFRLTATGVAPASPVTTTAQRATDDFVPANWHDDPQELTAAMPYQWFSRRKGSTGAWEEFSAPGLLTGLSSRTHDIGSAAQPAANLGNVGDTAINDAGMYWFKEATGWVLRGDLTDGPCLFLRRPDRGGPRVERCRRLTPSASTMTSLSGRMAA